MYWRASIREGDSLFPSGGRVQPNAQQFAVTYDGQNGCLEGDPVFCNACESWGITKCVPPYRSNTAPDGRQANLDGDLCLCKCPIPPRLKALHKNHRVGFGQHEVLGISGTDGWLAYAGHVLNSSSDHIGRYDEQMRLLAESVEGMPYRIEIDDGRVLSGTVGIDGLLPRIATHGDAEYTVYWGDEALARAIGER